MRTKEIITVLAVAVALVVGLLVYVNAAPVTHLGRGIERIIDQELGVACYYVYDGYPSNRALSCVKIDSAETASKDQKKKDPENVDR